ncbi:anti-phage dCTP deaminase [Shewanella psychromarinicola]|uniref:Cytidine deaminase n=1 Tax=Shewanella psychromarinicola TaxID=2487742 RepID=A0A3N4E9C2_9GAMM|nr:anti-phage dCTP deaminase [Shewanella psychromarinicola]AZG34676.1 cytidine deaminase [Shewanella psychromarinicola]MCL1083054.1 deaminase [Shewanella psychromarinicola]RPA33537.1 cytidine deaminase [Shewanella psychromarinicola]
MDIEEHSKNCELVIGLVAPIGVNLDDVQNRLSSYFSQFRYKTNFIHLSQVAKEFEGVTTGPNTEETRLNAAMNIGNNLRQNSKRGDLFALLAINAINKKRKGELPSPLPRHTHVIRSLKHPDEVETLRQVYGPGFVLLGISSSIESRKRYLRDEKGVPQDQIDDLIERDDKEAHPKGLGQRTRDVFQMADAFITSDDTESLSGQISRILDLLYSKPVVPPTSDEYAMFMAYAASLRSADLSRQVGAVLTNDQSDILATGANDVPKYGGGLYWPTDADQRDYKLGKDSNEEQKNQIILNIMQKFNTKNEVDLKVLLASGKEILKDTGLLDITEYGRAVHAEMEALMSSARNGISTRNSTLYTTTYPCHNCAKHIVAAGVSRVLYIEPYPKSFATILHDDSINSDGASNDEHKVSFEPFVGIGPRRFVDLFSMNLSSGRKLKRKQDGVVKEWVRSEAELRVPMTPLSYLEAEIMLVNQLDELKSDKDD